MIGLVPTMEVELGYLAGGARTVAGCDEVGRGALAGPVSVGFVVIEASTGPPPGALRDSKLLSALARERLVPEIEEWASDHAVGHASPAEIDRFGLTWALGLAGARAFAALRDAPEVVVLDGNHDFLGAARSTGRRPRRSSTPTVACRVRADLDCASVAAASVLAKVTRDRMMRALSRRYPGYGWAANKGYASTEHRIAIAELGASRQHRRTWRLLPDGDDGDDGDNGALDDRHAADRGSRG